MGFVYAAQVILALLFVHLRLTVPELFHRELMLYWPFIVMGIAFAGVGLGEYLDRRSLQVLAEPLQRTGLFLPMLPVLAFWLRSVGMLDEFAAWRLFGARPWFEYSLVWWLVGLLYTVLAVSRRSYPFALLAALAANAGLWSLWHHNQLHFLIHPQLWLIPIAVIVLVSEYLNRHRLSEAQCASLRYAALLAIYISSTADMFIAGLDENPFLPLVLAVLCLVGVLVGILLRVRAFLYLGVSFLLVVILTMIWHAAVGHHQIWVWWVSGIVLGAAIIGLFALFEKRRNDILHMLQELENWA
jgi:hypothetical protein